MSLKDKIGRWLFLRWLCGKVRDWRTKEGTMKKVLNALNGWKLLIGVVLMFGVQVYDQMNNGHAGDIVGSVLAIFGWLPSGIDFSQAVPAAVILIGVFHKVWKAQRQLQRGVAPADLLSAGEK